MPRGAGSQNVRIDVLDAEGGRKPEGQGWPESIPAASWYIKRQCGAPAVKGKRVCRFHGGKSTGPKTDEGRMRCGIAKTVHGGETRAMRAKRAQKMAELKEMEKIIKGW